MHFSKRHASFLFNGIPFFTDITFINLRRQPAFRDANTGFPAKWRLSNDCKNSIQMMSQDPGLEEICFNQSEALPRSWLWTSSAWNFLRRHFAGKPVVASRNVGLFLRIPFYTFATWANAQTHINSSLISSPPVEHLDVGHPVTRAARIDAPTANSACGPSEAI